MVGWITEKSIVFYLSDIQKERFSFFTGGKFEKFINALYLSKRTFSIVVVKFVITVFYQSIGIEMQVESFH